MDDVPGTVCRIEQYILPPVVHLQILESKTVHFHSDCVQVKWALKYCLLHSHRKLTSNSIGNRQLLGQKNVGIVSDFLTACLFSRGPVRIQFVYGTTRI